MQVTKLKFLYPKNLRKQNFLLVVIIFILIAYLGFSLYVAHVMTSPLALRIDTAATVISPNWEGVEFTANDGLKLQGWFFPGNSDKTIIMVHGLLANRVNTEYLGPLIAQELLAQGFNVLVYDTRAHGASGGKRVGFGANEGQDILGAVAFLEAKGYSKTKIGIIADSTGAVSTLMVIDQLRNVGAVVLDSTAADFQKIISNRLWVEKKVPKLLHPTIFFFDKVFFGVDIGSIKPIEKIALEPDRKFLFLHGRQDETIPVSDGQALLARANPKSRLVIFEGGNHIETFKSDPTLYRQEVYSFLAVELEN